MDFRPRIDGPREMDPRIFRDEPMGLERDLLGLDLSKRIAYDAAEDRLYLNFEGLQVHDLADVERVRQAVEEVCRGIGHKVPVVVNYDGAVIAEPAIDAYAAMVGDMEARWYTQVSRYTTSVFMRLKLGRALEDRAVKPHVFESRREAEAFHKRS
jgi:propionate CoA-transferase